MQSEKELIEKIEENFTPIEDKFNSVLEEVNLTLDDIASESEKLIESGETFAEQFGAKALSLVSDIKKPININLNDLNGYIATLQDFQKEIIYYGARWIRKISFRYKFTISRIENSRKRIFNLTQELKDLITNFQGDLKNWERAVNMVQKISKLKSKGVTDKTTLKYMNGRLDKLKRIVREHEQKIIDLRSEKGLKEAREVREAEEAFEESVKMEIRYLDKPISKSIRLIDRGEITGDQVKLVILERFINDPKSYLLNEDENLIEESLTFLQNLLKKKKLNLKGSRNRKGQETIRYLITEKKIGEYKEKFKEFDEENRRQLESSGILKKKEKLEGMKKHLIQNKDKFDELTKKKMMLEREITLNEEKIAEYNSKFDELLT